jgi:hypothetical protein
MKQNTFRNNKEPKPSTKDLMAQDIGRDASEVIKRNIPHFAEDLRSFHNPNIAYSQTIEKGEFGRYGR